MLKEVKLRELDHVFITDDVLPHPFDVAPSYLDIMLRDLRAPYIATTSDFETKPTYVLHVQATDSQGETLAQDVLVNGGTVANWR